MNKSIDFLKSTVIPEIEKLQENNCTLSSFILMTQCIEYIGGIIDKKPLKAVGQSQKRFSKAIQILFSPKWQFYNKNGILYEKLRNHLLHTFTVGSGIQLLSDENLKHLHLTIHDNNICIHNQQMLQDIKAVIAKMELKLNATTK